MLIKNRIVTGLIKEELGAAGGILADQWKCRIIVDQGKIVEVLSRDPFDDGDIL